MCIAKALPLGGIGIASALMGKDKKKTVYRNAPDRTQTVTALTPNGGAI